MSRSIGEQLASHVQRRTDWLNDTWDRLAEDPRIRAALLYGSFGRGTPDAWSDVDIILVIEDDALADLVALRLDFPTSFGAVLYLLDSTWNAPIDGGQVNALYDIGSALPLYVDWNFWPSRMAGHPDGTVVIFDRSAGGLPRVPKPFEEWATYERQPRPAAPDVHREFLRHAHFGMLPIAAKFVARRQREKLLAILAGIGAHEPGMSPTDEITEVRERLHAFREGQAQEAVLAIERLCSAAEAAARG